jgi:hypothetical protein
MNHCASKEDLKNLEMDLLKLTERVNGHEADIAYLKEQLLSFKNPPSSSNNTTSLSSSDFILLRSRVYYSFNP